MVLNLHQKREAVEAIELSRTSKWSCERDSFFSLSAFFILCRESNIPRFSGLGVYTKAAIGVSRILDKLGLVPWPSSRILSDVYSCSLPCFCFLSPVIERLRTPGYYALCVVNSTLLQQPSSLSLSQACLRVYGRSLYHCAPAHGRRAPFRSAGARLCDLD